MNKKAKLIIMSILACALILQLAACKPPIAPPESTAPATTAAPDETTTTPIAETEDPTMDIDGFEIEGNDGEGEGAQDNTSGLKSFSYSYSGTIGGNDYIYNVSEEDGKVTFEYTSMEYTGNDPYSMEVDHKVLDDLYQLYLDQRIAEWNGYTKYATNVLDGDGFSLMMEFGDGDRFFASGSNAYPERYFDFCSKMEEILKPYAEEVKDARRHAKISEGLKGDLSSFMVTFKQQGRSGSDSYEFFILHEGIRDKNFDVQITSDSGEFFDKGTYNYYSNLPNEAIDFDGIKKLIEKYNVLEWYDYDEAAEDYMNSEWFQVSFGFENTSINAMGTEHPEHYDEFRKEFLELMVDMIEKAEKDYGLESR